MYFQSLVCVVFFLHLCGEACQCCSIRHCVVNTTVKQTTVKFLPIDLQSLAMSSWRHSMSSRALWVILACASIIDPHFVSKIQVEGVKKKNKKNTKAKLGKVVQPQRDLKLRRGNKTTILFSASSFYISLQFKSTKLNYVTVSQGLMICFIWIVLLGLLVLLIQTKNIVEYLTPRLH